MKKVLIVSYLFPPFNQIGAKRAYYFAKYLQGHSFQVQVLSSELPESYSKWEVDTSDIDVYRIPVRNLNLVRYDNSALLARFYQFCNDLFAPIDSKARLQVSDIDYEKLNKPDYIIATGGPWHSLEVGAKLKEKWPDAKLILDYRDAWNIHDQSVSIDSLNNFGKGLGALKKQKFFQAEKKIVAQADGIIGVTKPIVDNVVQNPNFNFSNQLKSKVIYNGFEETHESAVFNSKQFLISYTGILRQEQEHQLFLNGFELFMERELVNRQEVALVFVGSNHPRLQDLISPFQNSKFANQIEITPFLDRKKVREYQDNSSLFINFSYTGKRGVMSGKIFEYLELKKPMLIVSKNDDEMENLVRKTNTGDIGQTANEIANILERRYQQWKENNLDYKPNPEGLNYFKNEFQIAALAEFIESL